MSDFFFTKRGVSERGFTLIELLVVIVIIAILAARKVAQIFNLLYRGFAIRLTAGFSKRRRDFRAVCRMQFGDTADCKSALRGTGGFTLIELRHHRDSCRNAAAGLGKGEAKSPGRELSEQPSPAHAGMADVFRRLQWPTRAKSRVWPV